MGKIKKIGVLTSGGDAPGMNAAIRAVVRTAIYHGLEVMGIRQGYAGLINADFIPLVSSSVSDIIQRGGTILKTARCEEFRTPEGRQKAYENLKAAQIDGVVVIGGDGSFTGARLFNEEYDIPFVGVPGTIDNDIYGTDYTIGYDTALNTVVQAVDKIRDTASAHDRMFFIEVMGAEAGFIALFSGIATGAEAIIIPEVKGEERDLKKILFDGNKRKKSSNLIIVAEGDEEGGAFAWAEKFKNEYPDINIRVTVLGHLQRGGSPTAIDRVNASRLGSAAVEALLDDQKSVMVGLQNDEIVLVPFSKAIKLHKDVNRDLLTLVRILSI
ncbi:MAG TPA: 6-phosphofructokinase [Bacteroidales bacterium]|nr:6-phosphofructokinase [Bacteroidales bacterium]HOK73697.1 6-phosphofructokinase [Bacteroidales bacterium]HOM39308.1 6-phosphofructokinase [Bacteroidales bacterium]HPP91415.1 6-phosphofructokinase [Bacteroidales bacterium]HQG55568.1 6-phosphofructokinase [Bacteroidales bacterium]